MCRSAQIEDRSVLVRDLVIGNAGFIILGLIIEELTGVSYDEYVYGHILEASGMFAAGAEDVEDDFADLAIGYTTMDIAGNDTGR